MRCSGSVASACYFFFVGNPSPGKGPFGKGARPQGGFLALVRAGRGRKAAGRKREVGLQVRSKGSAVIFFELVNITHKREPGRPVG